YDARDRAVERQVLRWLGGEVELDQMPTADGARTFLARDAEHEPLEREAGAVRQPVAPDLLAERIDEAIALTMHVRRQPGPAVVPAGASDRDGMEQRLPHPVRVDVAAEALSHFDEQRAGIVAVGDLEPGGIADVICPRRLVGPARQRRTRWRRGQARIVAV